MALPLMQKKSFVRSGEGSVASYSWSDIASGIGYVDFYALAKGGVDGSMILVTKPVDNGAAYVTFTAAEEQTMTASAFSTPRTVGGVGYCSLACYNTGSTAVGWTLTIQKESGGVTTDISAATATDNTAASTGEFVLYTPITITETNFKIGDILKIKIVAGGNLRLHALGTGGKYVYFAIPFKIDL